MKVHRPGSVKEALALLSEGVPLAGGTALVPDRRSLEAVIVLDGLGLDEVQVSPEGFHFGAAVKLQALLAPELNIPASLKQASRHEAAWNLRNMATIGGTIMSGDGRSPLLLALLTLRPTIRLSGNDSDVTLDTLLDRRANGGAPFLIEQVRFEQPRRMHYEYVARAPSDRPLVSAAAAAPTGDDTAALAIGGFGGRPLLLEPVLEGSIDQAVKQAGGHFAQAGDAFASAEYRSEVVQTLAARVLKGVLT